MQIGDLVRSRKQPSRIMIPTPAAPQGIGVITNKRGKEIVYVYWGIGKPRPISVRLLEKCNDK